MYNWMSLADRPWHSLCTSIQRVVIEEGVTTTGYHAFYGASNLTSVSLPSTLQTLQFMTFFGCSKLTTLTIPSSVTYVGNRSLEGCSALTDVYMSETGDAIPTMPVGIHTYDASRIRLHIPCGQAGAYFAKGWNTMFTIDGVVSGTCGDNVQWTFESCNGTLTIFGTGPMAKYAYTNQVPWYSFRESITSVTIANGVTTIGQPAFYNCSNLTSVSIGTGVTTICRQAFQKCTNLPSITIGDHVTTIERRAFDNCSGLTSITIPPSVTSIGEEAFNGCYAMESLYITDLTAWCNISFDGIYATPFIRNGFASYRGGGNLFLNGVQVTTLTIPDGVTEIKDYTFYGFAGITDVQFNQVTTIGRSAFNSNHGLTDITIPEGVTIINPNAFNYCTSLQSISIPESVTTIGNRALRKTALTDIYVYWTGNIPAWDELTDKYPQSDITLHVPCGTTSLYQAADGWKDYRITDDIASGICGATGHESDVTWSLSCDGTLTIQGTGAMADWSSSDKVPWYSYRSSITTVNIRDGVTSVGNRAFIDCAVLTSVTIPNSVTSISNNAFFSCSALANIAIPNSVTTIGQYVFYGCSALTNITIPNSVTSLGESIFRNCSALTDMYVSWTSSIPTWPTGFTNKSPQSDITLHVPCGTGDVYAAQDGWKDYTIEGEGTFTITVESDDPTMGTVDAVKIEE